MISQRTTEGARFSCRAQKEERNIEVRYRDRRKWSPIDRRVTGPRGVPEVN